MPKPLDAERRTLRRHLPRLRKTARARFVLIHGSKVVDTFSTEPEALSAGYAMYGPHGVFLIDEIGADERPRLVTFLGPTRRSELSALGKPVPMITRPEDFA